MTCDLPEVSAYEDHTFELELKTKNATTRKSGPLTPAVGFQAWFSLTEDGPAIDAALVTNLTEASGAPGDVFGTVDVAIMLAKMAGQVGKFPYEVYQSPDGQRWSRQVKIVKVRSI